MEEKPEQHQNETAEIRKKGSRLDGLLSYADITLTTAPAFAYGVYDGLCADKSFSGEHFARAAELNFVSGSVAGYITLKTSQAKKGKLAAILSLFGAGLYGGISSIPAYPAGWAIGRVARLLSC